MVTGDHVGNGRFRGGRGVGNRAVNTEADKTLGLTREFLDRRDMAVDGANPTEAALFRFVKSWHRFPALREILHYRGVNLGEMVEYYLIQEAFISLGGGDERAGPR